MYDHTSHCVRLADWSHTVLVHQRLVTFQPDNRYVGNLTSANFLKTTKKYWLDLVPSMYILENLQRSDNNDPCRGPRFHRGARAGNIQASATAVLQVQQACIHDIRHTSAALLVHDYAWLQRSGSERGQIRHGHGYDIDIQVFKF